MGLTFEKNSIANQFSVKYGDTPIGVLSIYGKRFSFTPNGFALSQHDFAEITAFAKTQQNYKIEFTPEECYTLIMILRRIGGSLSDSARKFADSVSNKITDIADIKITDEFLECAEILTENMWFTEDSICKINELIRKA